MWTSEQYIQWKKTRGPETTWTHEDCRAADNLIRTTALRAFHQRLKTEVENKSLRNFIFVIVAAHFGSADVHDLFMELNLYPDWI